MVIPFIKETLWRPSFPGSRQQAAPPGLSSA
jgi:hypothetical protein